MYLRNWRLKYKINELSNNPTTQEIAAAYSTIEEQAGYTKEEIDKRDSNRANLGEIYDSIKQH